MAAVKQGDTVTVHYTGKFEDGDVFDSSSGGEPLKFTAGGQEVIPGVSNAVVGMNTGDSKTVTVSAEEGYGERQEGLLQKVPRAQLPPEVKVGDPLQAQVEGNNFIFWVKDLDEEFATLDANHPLAGKTLVFELELVENLSS